MIYNKDIKFAIGLDKEDPLKDYRRMFFMPDKNGQSALYFTGNSLGLQPKTTKFYIEEVMRDWQNLGSLAHDESATPWVKYHSLFDDEAALIGALPSEVVLMNALSVNLHLMMASFYKPKGKRTKVLMEAGAFPSDQYAVETHLAFHGLSYEDNIIEVAPRKGEYTLRQEDIVKAVEENKKELALVLFGAVNYYTGQLFDLAGITKAGQKAGAIVGFDLAHAIGNVPLNMHEIGADFAVWCTYKYLNSGPGSVGGIFVHEKHSNDTSIGRLGGWWGTDEPKRFKMERGFKAQKGAAGWQISNAPVFPLAIHKASLDIFKEVGMEALRKKSIQLTGYLEFLIKDNPNFTIITPSDPTQRGCQLSLLTQKGGKELFEKLGKAGIVADWREPNVIRVAPVPLYNTYTDVYNLAQVLNS